jgi:sterol desaturase/sphingolipid hydroxylase (fatty acid hydroxylase superfamily)
MIWHHLFTLLETIAVVYAALLATYLLTGLALIRFNERLAAKIQRERVTRPALVRRDLQQSVLSLLCIAAMFGTGHWAYETLGWGLAPPSGVLGTALSLLASMLVFDAWFYWFHRLIHSRPLFRRVHQWHHITLTPMAWSNNSDKVIDNLFLQSYWLVAHLLLPVAPAVLFAHKIYDQVTGVIGHSGYEHAGSICRPPSPLVAVTHHDQHHRYFRCNYATHFTLWDRLMGTLHPTHDAEVRANLAASLRARRERKGATEAWRNPEAAAKNRPSGAA